MRYNELGHTGIFVSEICLGAMTFGEPGGQAQWGQIAKVDQAAADEIVQRSLAAGVNFIDARPRGGRRQSINAAPVLR